MSLKVLNISVNIAGRSYRMKVSSEEEVNVREAANLLNAKIDEFKNQYDANDNQDYLAMAAILYTTEYLKKDTAEETISDVVENALSDIDTQLSEIERL